MPRVNLRKLKRNRPQAATIRRVMEHLAELGLSVYGQCADVKDPKQGQYHRACMDYTPAQVLALRRHLDRGTMLPVDDDE